jgi:hypothetical protein
MRKIKEYEGIYDRLAHSIRGISTTFRSFLTHFILPESGLKERRSAGYEEKERRIREEYQRGLQA